MPEGVSVALFTCDLRVHDSPVLHAATAHPETVPVFVLDDSILGPLDDTSQGPAPGPGLTSPNRSAFLADCLAELDAALRSRGGRLVLLSGDTVTETTRLARWVGATRVHLAAGASAFAQRREARLRRALGDRLVVHDTVESGVAPGAVVPSGRDHYAVFGAYHRQWVLAPRRAPLPAPRAVRLPARAVGLSLGLAEVTAALTAGGRAAPGLAHGGEGHGRRRLRSWMATDSADYAERHDDLPGDATSRLSPYLHFGCLSVTEVAHAAAGAGTPGAEAFLRQLAWRDFHHQLLAARPDTARTDYRSRDDHWRHKTAEFDAWRAGRTGYPLVDAGMRQLLHEGWMHNRARMVTASFLTKTLYCDWRAGAAHFMHHLVDADVANNQLNWQWVAGTGTDSRPNRVLNPLRQAQRFDPDGSYVRRWVPELASVPGPAAHRPWLLPAAERSRLDYPDPVADLDESLARFRRARGL